MTRFLETVEEWLTRAERALLVLFVVVMVGLSFLQVVLRVRFKMGILWGDTLGRNLVLWVGFIGAGVAAARDKQFAMDLSSRLFSGRARGAVGLACHLFSLGVCGFLTAASIGFFKEEYAQHAALFAVGGVQVPAWAFELILPGGFALLGAHYLIKSGLAFDALLFGPEKP